MEQPSWINQLPAAPEWQQKMPATKKGSRRAGIHDKKMFTPLFKIQII